MNIWTASKEKIYALLAEEFRVSLMNETKWTEVAGLLRRLGIGGRVKLITEDESRGYVPCADMPDSFLDVGLPISWLAVEWMDIWTVREVHRGALLAPHRLDQSGLLEEGLRVIGVPFTREGEDYRVWGHVRRGEYPELES
jgi:hypothetical protein